MEACDAGQNVLSILNVADSGTRIKQDPKCLTNMKLLLMSTNGTSYQFAEDLLAATLGSSGMPVSKIDPRQSRPTMAVMSISNGYSAV